MQNIVGAVVRGCLLFITFVLPGLFLPDPAQQGQVILLLFCAFCAIMTTAEYISDTPSIIAFRHLRPFNRIRFAGMLVTVVVLLISSPWLIEIDRASYLQSDVLLRIMFWLNPGALSIVDAGFLYTARISAIGALFTLLVFLIALRRWSWPEGRPAVQVWANIPLFEPRQDAQIGTRLRRDAVLWFVVALVLFFFSPSIAHLVLGAYFPFYVAESQHTIWFCIFWTHIPVTFIMRSLTLLRIASYLEENMRAKTGGKPGDAMTEPMLKHVQ